jgi:hypothetical protein
MISTSGLEMQASLLLTSSAERHAMFDRRSQRDAFAQL